MHEVCENLNFPTICLNPIPTQARILFITIILYYGAKPWGNGGKQHAAANNQATSQKRLSYNITGFSVLIAKLFGQENQNSDFHKFLYGDMNNTDEFLNSRHLF